MFRWLVVCALLCGGAYYVVSRIAPKTDATADHRSDKTRELVDVRLPNITPNPTLGPRNGHRAFTIDNARIAVLDRQDVGADRDGQIMFIGTEVKPGEKVPDDRLITQTFVYILVEVKYVGGKEPVPLVGSPEGAPPVRVPVEVPDPDGGGLKPNLVTFDEKKYYTRWQERMPLYAGHCLLQDEVKTFRKLKEQERVEKGKIVALVNSDLAVTELRNKHVKLLAAEADRAASEKTRDEAKARVRSLDLMRASLKDSVNMEEYRGAELNVSRYTNEEIAKRAQVRAAEFDVVAAMGVVSKHEVRAAISAVVKTIGKNRGDTVKANQDTILQIVNPLSLKAEALAEVQDVRKLQEGQPVQLEVSLRVTPTMTLPGLARREINAVAVSNGAGGKPRLIVAASEDGTLRCWDVASGQEYCSPVRLPSPARALACSPRGAEGNLLLIGTADGSAHLYDLAEPQLAPVALPERHRGPITAVAFSPDGKTCATGGADDRAIMLWSFTKAEGATDGKWERQQVLTDAHRGAITSLAFTALPRDSGAPPDDTGNWRLLSAGRDNALIVWKAERGKPLAKDAEFNRRSGDVTQFSPDGDRVLFDSGKELRVLSLRERRIVGTLRTSTGAGAFSTMALFSPDGLTVLTNGPEGHPQLWRAPPKPGSPNMYISEGRGSELRQLASSSVATCGTFDPDGAFAVTGTQDGQVLVWEMPNADEIEKRIPATVALAEEGEDFGKARVGVEVKENPLWYKITAKSCAALRAKDVRKEVVSALEETLKGKELAKEPFLREIARSLAKTKATKEEIGEVFRHAETRPWLVPGSTATIVVTP
jgi:WD40 repeat protein